MTEKTTDFDVTSSEQLFEADHFVTEQAVSGPLGGSALTRLWPVDHSSFLHTRRAGPHTRSGSRAGGLKILVPGSLPATYHVKASLPATYHVKASLPATYHVNTGLSHPRLSSPVYGPALLLLLAACGGSTGGNPNTFVPPVTRIDGDGVTILSNDGQIDGDAAAVQAGQSSLADALTGAGVAQADADIVNAHGLKGTGVYVLSSDVVARISSDYIDEFNRLVYGEDAPVSITTANKFTGPGGAGHADFGTFILSHAESNDYTGNYGSGAHALSYQLAPSPVHVDLSYEGSSSQRHDGVWANSWSADDRIAGTINHIIGSSFDDILSGNRHASDAETFEGGPGADIIDGRGGVDTASYEHSKAPVDVDLARQGTSGIRHNQRGGDAVGDKLTSIENLIGTAYADRLYGDQNNNIFYGLGGGDEIDGRGGTDTVSYDRSRGPVHINLEETANAHGFIGVQLGNGAENDRLRNIENIEGSRYDDSFRGNGGANRFTGNDGDDSFYWSEGADSFDGGAGTDTADYSAVKGGTAGWNNTGITVNLNTDGAVTKGGTGTTDELTNVETVIGTDLNDTITGTGGVNHIDGRGGNDTLNGVNGNDRIIGGAGADTIDGGNGTDIHSYDSVTQNAVYDENKAAGEQTGGRGLGIVYGSTGGNNTGSQFNLEQSLASEQVTVTAASKVILLYSSDYPPDTNKQNRLIAETTPDQPQTHKYAIVAVLDEGRIVWQMQMRVKGKDGNERLVDFFDPPSAGQLTFSVNRLVADNLVAGLSYDAAGDIVSNVEHIEGSRNSDYIVGSSNFDDHLFGLDGNDVLVGRGGDDVLYGGLGKDYLMGGRSPGDANAGEDTASYQFARTGVVVDLYDNDLAESQGEAEGDILVDIDNLSGSIRADRLYGDQNANDIRGNGGDDILSGRAGNDRLYGNAGNDTLYGGAGADRLEGGSGDDLLFGDSGHGNPEKVGDRTIVPGAGLQAVNTAIAYNDTLYGGNGNDTLYGQHGDDTLYGGAGRNSLFGGDGNDTFNPSLNADGSDYTSPRSVFAANYFDGGAGDDTLSYHGQAGFVQGVTGVTVFVGSGDVRDYYEADNGPLTQSFVADKDRTVSVEYVRGTAGRDTVYLAGKGAFVEGGNGADKYISVHDNVHDYVSYRNATAGVTVYLDNSQDNTGEAAGDSFTNIQNIEGSGRNDVLHGTNQDNIFIGGAGDDTIDGKAGNDTASYASSSAAVTVNLSVSGAQDTGGAGSDTLTNIENLIGSAHNDALTGDAGANRIDGGAGNDVIDGGDGADILSGGAGDDVILSSDLYANAIDGGAGTDTLSYAGLAENTDTNIGRWLAGEPKTAYPRGGEGWTSDDPSDSFIAITGIFADLATHQVFKQHGVGPAEISDTGITGIENITGSGFADYIAGDGAANILIGGAGDDYLYGRAGADSLHGNDGADTLYGGADDDVLTGGDGNDWLDGGDGDDTLTGGAGADRLFGEGWQQHRLLCRV